MIQNTQELKIEKSKTSKVAHEHELSRTVQQMLQMFTTVKCEAQLRPTNNEVAINKRKIIALTYGVLVFTRATLCVIAVFAVERCPSVRPSVTRLYSV